MMKLVQRFSELVKGTINGFDRIVFKGCILPLMSATETMKFCRFKGILNKDYKSWMMEQTTKIVDAAEQYAQNKSGQSITHLSIWKTRKESLAHERQQATGITSGLIGVWSCLEAGSSYRARYSAKTGYPLLQNYQTQCKHLYFYFDDPQLGFMNIRLQTWFPYHIQVCLNGREWLRRDLEREGVGFLARGNKFLHIADYDRAQQLLDKQRAVRFPELLNNFLPVVFPVMSGVLGNYLSYYWTLWQSEWATDLVFSSPDKLSGIMDSLLRHALVTGTSTRVLCYLDRPLTKDGNPYSCSRDEVVTRLTGFNNGIRLRHWVGRNSVKVYNEQNVLRVETTINDPGKFKDFRHKQGQAEDEPKQRLIMRKGVADIAVSQDINNRLMGDLATLHDSTPARDCLDEIVHHIAKNGRRFRGIDPTGKDREILLAISDPAFRISALTNKMVREKLSGSPVLARRTDKQCAAKISRYLRLLRAHGILRKEPSQNRYQLTLKGARLTNLLQGILAVSTENLMKMAA
jgi:hypothetical protein